MTRSVIDVPSTPKFPVHSLLHQLIREGAAALLAAAVEAELEEFLEQHAQLRTADGARAVVRNGYLPKRTLQTTVGNIEIHVPRVRDRSHSGVYFTSLLVPPYLKRVQAYDERLPWLYLKGHASGNFEEALLQLLGKQANRLSVHTTLRLRNLWQMEHEAWCQQSLKNKNYLYWRVESLSARAHDESNLLVIAGVTENGYREMVAIDHSSTEPELKWIQLLQDLRSRGLKSVPKFIEGDNLPAFWKAYVLIFPEAATVAQSQIEQLDHPSNTLVDNFGAVAELEFPPPH